MSAAIAEAKGVEGVKARLGPAYTRPNFTREGKTQGWRVRREIVLESTRMVALAQLGERMQLAETARAFRARAADAAAAFGFAGYELRELAPRARGNALGPAADPELRRYRWPTSHGSLRATGVASPPICTPPTRLPCCVRPLARFCRCVTPCLDTHDTPLDPNFLGAGCTLTDGDGHYRFLTIKPGAYPWGSHPNAWRPNPIHFSLFGEHFASHLVTLMYFPPLGAAVLSAARRPIGGDCLGRVPLGIVG